jgi:choline kinase
MKCLIIAAGKGTRLANLGDSKPLVPLLGKPLIIRVIETARTAGIEEFYVVTGYKAETIEKTLTAFAVKNRVSVNFIYNQEWEKQNGISVLKGSEKLHEPFFLLMSDHIFDKSILRILKYFPSGFDEVVLAVDTRITGNPLVDLEDVTKVQVEAGDIIDIGKSIFPYNAFDTGIFLCTPVIFSALAESARKGDTSLSGGIRVLASQKKAKVMDIGNASWIDVDNEEMLKKAEIMLARKNK